MTASRRFQLPTLAACLRAGMALCIATFAISASAQLPSRPGDWPAWRGPGRDGLSRETGLLSQWPEDGPRLKWKLTGLGDGYSTPSVADGKLFVLGGTDRTEFIFAIDTAKGEIVWKTEIGKMRGGYPGPRSTPTVDGGLLYALSSDGKLVCADTAKGAIRWQKDIVKEFNGRSGGWAYTESPLIDGDLVLCTPGGDKHTFAALNKRNGEVVWTSAISDPRPEDKEPEQKGKKKRRRRGNFNTAGYSSIIVANLQGKKQYVQFLSGGVVGIDASNGKLLWYYDHPANGTANISTPLVYQNGVFAATGYGTGGGLARIKKDGDKFHADEAYFISKLQNHHGGMIIVGDYLYGTNGSGLMCVNLKTGEIVWFERGVGKGSVFFADGHLYHRSEQGPVALVEATPEGYREKGRFNQPERSKQRAWAHPVVAGGNLYLRDWDTLFCYDVKAPGK